MAVLAEHNSSSEIVLETQKLINKSILRSRSPESGEFCAKTVSALKTFQTESGLRPTGVLDESLMKTLKLAANKPNPTKQIYIGSKVYLFTDSEYKILVKRVIDEFTPAMNTLRSAVAEARIIWDAQNDLNNDKYIVAWFVEAFARTNLPPESLIKSAESSLKTAEAALKSGNLAAFAKVFPEAQKQCNIARVKMKNYLSNIIDGSEGITTKLETASNTSFMILGLIAAPVAVTYGAGAVAATVVAGAGLSGVETLATEVGKGIAGSSNGFKSAGYNVLKDTFIGGSVGAVLKGKAGEKIITKLGPVIAKNLSGKLFANASKNTVTNFVIKHLQSNGNRMLDGIITDVLKEFKSKSNGLTVDKFFDIVGKQVITAGLFSKFEKLGDFGAKSILAKVSASTKKEWLKTLGDKAKEADLEVILTKVLTKGEKSFAGYVFDKALSNITGKETPDQIKVKIIGELATDKKLIDAVKAEAEKNAQKKK